MERCPVQSSVCTGMTDPVVRNMDGTKIICAKENQLWVEMHAGNANCNFFDAFFSKPLKIPFNNSKVASLELSKEAWFWSQCKFGKKTDGVEFCGAFPRVLSTSGCTYTVKKSAKEQAWTLDCDCLSCTVKVHPDSAWTAPKCLDKLLGTVSSSNYSPSLAGVRPDQVGLLLPDSCQFSHSRWCAQALCDSLWYAALVSWALFCHRVLTLERRLKIRGAGDQHMLCSFCCLFFFYVAVTEAAAINQCCFHKPQGIFCLKPEYGNIHQGTDMLEPYVWGLQVPYQHGHVSGWPWAEMLLLNFLDVNLIVLIYSVGGDWTQQKHPLTLDAIL